MEIRSRYLPLIVALIVVPVVAAFVFAGPAVGVAAGALAAVAIAVTAANMHPRHGVEVAPLRTLRRHLLVVISVGVSDPDAIGAITAEARAAGSDVESEVLVLAPAQSNFLDRWASDTGPARDAAQRKLAVTVASLAKAGIDARARIGDGSLIQATEDELRSYPATEVILATGEPKTDEAGARAAVDLAERLQIPLRHVVIPGEAGEAS